MRLTPRAIINTALDLERLKFNVIYYFLISHETFYADIFDAQPRPVTLDGGRAGRRVRLTSRELNGF